MTSCSLKWLRSVRLPKWQVQALSRSTCVSARSWS